MRMPGKNRKTDDQLRSERREARETAQRAARTAADTSAPMPEREAALGELRRAHGEVLETSGELRGRTDQIAAVGETERRQELLDGRREPQTAYERMLLEQAIAERERRDANERRRIADERRRHDERREAGTALEPLWNDEPHLELVALMASGRLWSWSRALAVPGEDVRDIDGRIVTSDELALRDYRLPSALVDPGEIVCLWAAGHLIAERGENGAVTINSKQPRIWPEGIQNVVGSLRRLHEVKLLEIDLTNVHAWRIGWGETARVELARFVASFTPPAAPAKQSRRERRAEERETTAPSSLPESGRADRERAAERREQEHGE